MHCTLKIWSVNYYSALLKTRDKSFSKPYPLKGSQKIAKVIKKSKKIAFFKTIRTVFDS